jgi:hypothetical protein
MIGPPLVIPEGAPLVKRVLLEEELDFLSGKGSVNPSLPPISSGRK